MPQPTVLHQRVAPGIAVLRLNRPDKRNALDTATTELFADSLDELAGDPELRALVISSTDPRALCAGADIGESLDHDGGIARMAAYTRMYAAIESFPVPTVAVCVGNCVGAGAEIAAGADLRVGGDNLKLAWAGARLGVPVGPARLAPLIGLARAKDLVFTGRTIGMDEARDLGLLHRTATAAEAEAVALDVAAQIARQDPRGVRVLKAMFAELDGSATRVAYENRQLMQFQEHGQGLPRG
ncbi:enoyl-CoA hydratase/isomerase family protein [Jatrophihabitans cynanchi]|jgi:enoyl-CoA hydratase/carnithine racemase|uniref:Enoyl-CoA hydratase/isomerase family protein n=1 Tax=Jatrophihabitans cynanchi TaxID=2944128 RepID=A0ABY7JU44_9ACTN|nr:enoyl-CoA hydratase/isomerase family protein [Jatrophihabitans sp. SB3-54]WAX56081.1 enoyl-CoA hydratase/isomerase family protein [Jatrophihabitans sp. SB3-54]